MHLKKMILSTLVMILISLSLAADDLKIDSSIFGDIKARNIGPAVMSGRITDIACSSKDTAIIYIGTAGGGVWKSIDSGITFKPIFDEYNMSIGCLTVDENNPETVWVGTGETNMRNSVSVGSGLFRTTDGGKSWKCMGFEDSEKISKVVIDPRDSKVIYTAIAGHLWNNHPTRGLYKSTDNGQTWKQILYTDETTGCIDLEINPKNPDILFAAMWEFRRKPYFFTSGGKGSALYKTSDAGKTWKKITNGLPKGDLGRIEMDISLSSPNIMYAIVEAAETGLYKSEDGGESWFEAGTGFGIKMRPFYLATLKVDPVDPQRVYNPSLILSVSKNGGKSFETSIMNFSGITVHPDHHALWINPQKPEHLLLGTDGGVYVSYNRGQSFRHISNIPVSQFYHLSVDQEIPYNVYGGLQDNNSWYGPSSIIGGSSILNKNWTCVGGGDGFYVFRDPTDKDIVYYTWQGGMLQRYNERTGENASIRPLPSEKDPPYRFNWNAGMALSPHHKNIMYYGAQFLFKSYDNGKSWEKISPDLTTNDPKKQQQAKSGGLTIDNTTAENHCTIITICESPLDEKIIWVGTDDGNVQVTSDGGQKWQNVVKNIKGLPKNTWCPAIEAGHYDKGTAYAVFDGHRTGDMKTYVYRTEDFGKTWTSLTVGSDELEGYAHVIREDLVNRNMLFLGTEFGLYVSFNRGSSWVHFKETLPKVAIRDIVIHPVEHDLVLATHGRGIYILDDITPLRHLDENVFNQEVALLPARPNYTNLPGQPFEGGMTGDTEFFGEGPKDGAAITYYLKKRHIFGEMKLEILDQSGKVIKNLPTGKRKGINRVFWTMTLKAPKAGTSPGLSGFVFRGPTVDPGTYTVRLTMNQKVYESKLVLHPPRLAIHSEADLELRQEALWKSYYMLEHLAYIADSLNNIQTSLGKIVKNKDKKLSPKMVKYFQGEFERVRAIHGQIIDPSGSPYGSELLQARMIDIYSALNSYPGRPAESQLTYLVTLEHEVQAIETRFEKFVKENLVKLNSVSKELGIEEIKVLTEEEFQKKNQEE